jgi:hypothetical protein
VAGKRQWYERLRQRYRPSELRFLFIAESPPDLGTGERDFSTRRISQGTTTSIVASRKRCTAPAVTSISSESRRYFSNYQYDVI